MYTLNDDQIASVKGFINKIPDSLIKSRCEKWLAEVEPTQRATSEQMEQFVSFSTHLPKELQNFPQSFAQSAKNLPETEKREAKEGTTETASLVETTNESISEVPDAKAPKNKEATLHKLGTKKDGKQQIAKPATKGKGK